MHLLTDVKVTELQINDVICYGSDFGVNAVGIVVDRNDQRVVLEGLTDRPNPDGAVRWQYAFRGWNSGMFEVLRLPQPSEGL